MVISTNSGKVNALFLENIAGKFTLLHALPSIFFVRISLTSNKSLIKKSTTQRSMQMKHSLHLHLLLGCFTPSSNLSSVNIFAKLTKSSNFANLV